MGQNRLKLAQLIKSWQTCRCKMQQLHEGAVPSLHVESAEFFAASLLKILRACTTGERTLMNGTLYRVILEFTQPMPMHITDRYIVMPQAAN